MDIPVLGTWFSTLPAEAQGIIQGCVVIVASIWALALIKRSGLFILRSLRKKENTLWNTTVRQVEQRLNWMLFLPLAVGGSLDFFPLSEQLQNVLHRIIQIVLILHAFSFLQVVISYLVHKFSDNNDEENTHMTELMAQLFTVGVWLSAGFTVIQVLGINLTGLLGGLGIATVIAGFALQNVLSDFFAFFSIHADKPFEVGDFIIVDKDIGTVVKVGFQSTRLRTLEGQELTLPNRKLIESRVNNYRRMQTRRIDFEFCVSLDTSTEKLRKIPEWIKNILSTFEQVTLDRVHFKEIEETRFRFEVVYYLDSSDYAIYMDIRQEFNLLLLEKLKRERVALAQPLIQVDLRKR